MDIVEAIQKISKQGQQDTRIQVAKVLSVEGTTCTVELLDSQFEINEVRLQTETSNGVLLIPAVDSFVIIAPIDDFEYIVVMYSALDSIQFLDGSFGGLVKVVDLVTKLNNLENKVNSLITYINSHTHASNGTPPSPSFVGGSLTPTVRNDIENTKVTHGNV